MAFHRRMQDTQISMGVFRKKWTDRRLRSGAIVPACVTALTFAGMAFGWQAPSAKAARRIYVEPFTTRDGSQKLRADVIGELRKQSSVAVTETESAADLLLGGGGEVWVKGYVSLNPRSGRSPSSGQAVYAGYLSVELRNKRGETLWSDLVTPGGATEDVFKDLAKRIAKHVGEGMEQGGVPSRSAAPSGPVTALEGAGATFPFPVYAKWITNYRRMNPNTNIHYEAVGSEAGVRKLLTGSVDFGASDSPEVIGELAPGTEGKYLLLPTVVGAVVPIVNLPGLVGEISFTPEALAGIYLGKIKKWNDPALTQANRGLHLPDLDIVVVHRSDGSGTSYAWTDFLSQTNPQWRNEIGAHLAPAWPTGRAVEGNDGVAQTVKELGGSIGYVEYMFALQNHLTYGRVRNQSGRFVDASLESIAAAVQQMMAISDDLKVSLVNAPGAGTYPIASFTWLVVPRHIADSAKRNSLVDFLHWALGPGQAQAAALGYLELPKDLVGRELAAMAGIQ
jgi:phosphate transport system substrate-binding protein